MVGVKICGLTRAEDARVAEAAGADYLGAILAGGPRVLSPEQARLVLGARRAGVRRVAVFGDQPASEVIDVANRLELDVIQLHGERSATEVAVIVRASPCAVWPVIRVTGTVLPASAPALAAACGALVLDAHVVGQLGGTGVALDWAGLADAVARLRETAPPLTLVLAGGLRPGNVVKAIGLLSPEVVDVSSGVEFAPGVKDPMRVQQFVRVARDAAEMAR